MLARWSRAVRTPGTCRCMSCLSNGSAVATRGGAIGLRGSWALGTPTSTFVYTAVFAAGLAFDAKAKRNRNGQWDAAFAHLREELGQSHIQEQGNRTKSAATENAECEENVSFGEGNFIPIEELFKNGVDWDRVYRVSGMELDDGVLDDGVVLPKRQHDIHLDLGHLSESLWHLLPYDSRLPSAPVLEWSANTGRDMIRHHLPPQSLWAPEHMRWTAIRKRQHWKKLAIQELSVGMLIYTLLGRTNATRLNADSLTSLSPLIDKAAQHDDGQRQNLRQNILESLENLYTLPAEASSEQVARAKSPATNLAVPQYHQDSDGDFISICKQMNIAIKNIITQDYFDDCETALATSKICHNLLVSTAAPDLQTFNMLLIGFGRWKQTDLVDAVIAALDACKIRPNEITCSAVLNHYIQNDRPDRFSKFVAKMRGVGNALMMARSDIVINEKGQDRLVRVNEKKIYQKVYPTPMVFNTLMLGVLRFAGFERAMEVYYDMKDDGWGMDVLGLGHFLEDCIRRADWNGGLYVWEEINGIKSRVKPAHMAKAYAQMLSLCSVTGKTVAFNSVLNDLVRRGFDRKRILQSALGTTQLSQERIDTVAPAWTADNVLIAVSDYLQGSKNAGQDERPSTPDTPEEAIGTAFDYRLAPDHEASGPKQIPVKDADEAWAVWMQHELGEPVGQTSSKDEAPEQPARARRTRKKRTSAELPTESKGDPFDGYASGL
ncbi:hypothetical protein K458DRAFT_476411 [Lentithecium fluviatile CBS 122367]|uniref:Pentatricopeptide repeat protein n=1 Tax=Lentithecium fluviatile CBS 122367 TaxID=1168545 RepID=A0A6G1J8U0_9PLEO|nr:hypothetical protein K458DRAFT_476411 [Lentithecium fluviatile CBS 122367]